MATPGPTEAPPPYHRRQSAQDLAVPISDVERMSMEDEERPLPDGWIRQFDRASAHHFYVDTKATPPRSIWVHPYEDAQYQKEHPDTTTSGPSSSSTAGSSGSRPPDPPVSTAQGKLQKRGDAPPKSPTTETSPGSPTKRGFFGKLKDKAIGTKEEREAYKREREAAEREAYERHMERRRLLHEVQQRQAEAQQRRYQQYYDQAGPLGTAGYRYGSTYAAPVSAYGRRRTGYGGYGGGGYGSGYGDGYGGGYGGRGFGGAGMGLLGGLAGGLLLGEVLDGDF